MIGLLLMLCTSWAGDPLVRPPAPVSRAGECPQSISISKGEPITPQILKDGAAICSGVVVPTSQLAYLLATEVHRNALESVHIEDIRILQARLSEYEKPPSWVERPAVQRAIGGVVVGAVAVGLWTVYLTSGGK